MSEDKKENLVKRVCKELEITQKELSELLGTHLTTIQKWASSENIPKSAEKSLHLLLENKNLKERLFKFETAFELIEEARKK